MTTTIANSPPAFLEDLSVGQRFVSASYEVNADEIKAFARQYDPQPFHTDEATARDTFFARTGRQRLACRGGHHEAAGRRRRH